MIKGFDCATPLTAKTAAAFASDGFQFAARYLVPSSSWKALKKNEAEILNQAGIDIISVFETTADRALGGRVAGLADGATAIQVANQVGQPVGSCIYAAVDFEATTKQMKTVIEYIKGFSEATPDYTTGVYGSYAVVDAVWKAQACSRYWQTRAWSYGVVHPYAHIYQYDCGLKGLGLEMNGIGVDLNEGYEGLGSWNTLKVEEEKTMLSLEDANEMIALLQAIYKLAPNPELGRLADALRVASGQPKENS